MTVINSADNSELERAELLSLFDDFINGELSAADARRLKLRLLGDESARLLYVEYLDLHAALVEEQRSAASRGPDSLDRPERRRRRWQRRLAWGSALLVCLLAFGLWLVRPGLEDADGPQWSVPRASPVAVIRFDSAQAVFLESGDPPEAGATLYEGDAVQLSSGTVEVRFLSGVSGILAAGEGETGLRCVLESENGCRLDAGAGYFRVPPAARGFTVIGDAGTIVDLGTEFGVTVLAANQLEVQVVDGLVEAATSRSPHPIRLTRQTAATLSRDEDSPRVVPYSAARFASLRAFAGGVVNMTPSVRYHSEPQATFAQSENDVAHAHFFAEQRNVLLERRLRVPRPPGAAGEKQFQLARGTRVDSFFIEGRGSRPVEEPVPLEGAVTFARPVLAVLYYSQHLLETHGQFGLPDVEYKREPGIGLEVEGARFQDRVEISPDGRTVTFALAATRGNVDNIRVLIAAAEEEEREAAP